MPHMHVRASHPPTSLAPCPLAAFLLIAAALSFHVWLAWRAGGQAPQETDGSAATSCDGTPGTDTAAAAAHRTDTRPAAAVSPPLRDDASDGDAGSSPSGDSTPADSTPSASPAKKARSVAGSDVDSAMCDSPARSSPTASPGKRPVGGGAARGAPKRRRQRGASWRSVGLYLLPRLAVLLYFGAWLAALPASGAYSLHLHHYALAWAVAIFAAFNHPISGLVLALATAVFVQVGSPRRPHTVRCAWRGYRSALLAMGAQAMGETALLGRAGSVLGALTGLGVAPPDAGTAAAGPEHLTSCACARPFPAPPLQGASAYGFDPLFTPVEGSSTGCLTVSSPPLGPDDLRLLERHPL